MILPLRQRHRLVLIALGVILPVVFAVGVAARKPAPVAGELPAGLTAAPQSFAVVGQERTDLFAKVPLRVRLLQTQKESGRFAVELAADKNFVKPDLIVYWAAGNPGMADALPDNAILLGAFGSTALLLPEQATTSGGVLVLYSLADGAVVDVSQFLSLQTFNGPTH